MKSTKVYVVSTVSVWDGEEEVSINLVTLDKEKAQKKFNSLVKHEKDENVWWDKENPAFEDFSDTDNEFCCWEDGYFCENHIYISLNEETLK